MAAESPGQRAPVLPARCAPEMAMSGAVVAAHQDGIKKMKRQVRQVGMTGKRRSKNISVVVIEFQNRKSKVPASARSYLDILRF